MTDAEQLLKVDVSGRVWTSRERREALLDEFERSGTSAAQFAALVGVKYPTFASWVQMRRRQRGVGTQAGGAAALRWVEVMAGGAAGGGLWVLLPGGARMEVADAAQAVLAAELLRALARGSSPEARGSHNGEASC
jgi:hypothetical protein